jgi:hypothetical protein
MARSLGLAVCVVPVLLSCTSGPATEPDEVVDRIIAEDAAAAAAAQPLEGSYPDLRDVPPRPELGYTVEQRRQIQSGLMADMAYARHTSDLVRTTEGATPPPPPPSPEVEPHAEPATPAPARARAPKKVVLVERRDTSGDLSSFLDDVVGVDPEVDTTVEPSTVPAPRGVPSNQPSLAGAAPGAENVPVPGGDMPEENTDFFSTLNGLFSGSDVEAVTPPPPAATSAAGGNGTTQRAAAPSGEPLAVGRLWLFPLKQPGGGPTQRALAPMLEAVTQEGALQGRRLLVVGRSGDPALAAQRADLVVEEVTSAGVAPSDVERRLDTTTPGEAVTVEVLPANG